MGYTSCGEGLRWLTAYALPCLLQEKPVAIPESSREKKPREPPEFVRFYMGQCCTAAAISALYLVVCLHM